MKDDDIWEDDKVHILADQLASINGDVKGALIALAVLLLGGVPQLFQLSLGRDKTLMHDLTKFLDDLSLLGWITEMENTQIYLYISYRLLTTMFTLQVTTYKLT